MKSIPSILILLFLVSVNSFAQRNIDTLNGTITIKKDTIKPYFPGGESAMFRFLSDNIKYPSEDRDNGIFGNVVVSFVIDETGLVSVVKILRGVSPGIDAEAVRVIRIMPKWNPGICNGKNVKVQMTVPMKFVLK